MALPEGMTPRRLMLSDAQVAARLAAGASQRGLAAELGVSKTSIAKAARRHAQAVLDAAAVIEIQRQANIITGQPTDEPAPRGTDDAFVLYKERLDANDYWRSGEGRARRARLDAEETLRLRLEQERATGMLFDPTANDGVGALVRV